eukprot:CAMPEP_0198515678 /NCGR_PEP_ID=MMETSP1462-20131121/17464_1 /TAXON_ID=1333877 /ORGANISM="Brandtodinium nutriculum, Strain RCC3387" /LENGTH=64 /DNA_ID=CAMNT_0044245181 /DNA_START=74 /DNA_END=265 /DNA_ORIENTATION=+
MLPAWRCLTAGSGGAAIDAEATQHTVYFADVLADAAWCKTRAPPRLVGLAGRTTRPIAAQPCHR